MIRERYSTGVDSTTPVGGKSKNPTSISFVVIGQCYSLKNSKQLARGRTIKHPKARLFEETFALQVPADARNLMLGSSVSLLRANISVWYPSHLQDLDTAIVYDCLQRSGVISNDRYVVEKHEWGHVDVKNPRVAITIEEI